MSDLDELDRRITEEIRQYLSDEQGNVIPPRFVKDTDRVYIEYYHNCIFTKKE
jgi:hypothetical protein